jgi:N-terminal region of glycosyl transferase group 7
VAPTTVEPFNNASFYSSFNLTLPDATRYNALSPCNFSVSNNDTAIYKVSINQSLNTYQLMEANHAIDLYPGGHSMPASCRAEQRLALIICYRNREQHLKMFLDNIHPFLKKQFLDYTIFLVNQHGSDQFNRAALFNVGYIEAMKLYPFDCFIFHDVDLLPEDLRNVYRCGDQPRHM